MTIPPLLIGSALLFWGFQSEKAVIGILLFLVMEGSNLEKRRYRLEEEDFVKISDLTSLLFLGAVILVILNSETLSFLRITAGWLPLILSPLMAAQLYSTSDTITIGTRLGRKKKGYAHKPIDFRFYYIAVCLFAAATGNSRSLWFYVILAGIIAVLLFANRSKSYSIPFFVTLLGLSLGLGLFAGVAMEKGHGYVVHNSFRFLYRYYREQHADPYRTHVNFGDTGRQKLSGKILMRVDSESTPPYLFREAVYAVYQNGDWFGNQGGYEFLMPEDNEQWPLLENPETEGESLTVELSLPREKGLLSAPAGAYRLASTTIFELERHKNGSLRIIDGAKVAIYRIDHHPAVAPTDIPQQKNLVVPQEEQYALEQVREQLALTEPSPQAQIDAVRGFFAEGFSYSLNLLGKGQQATPLGNFLLLQKRGFCEYYATATTLLLRSLGIPSRYATGYAVSEKSLLEGKYIVRSRHAHAWAEAYVDDRWIAVDTTPAQWFAMDAERASVFEGFKDILSFILHKYRVFQTGSGRDLTLPLSTIVVLLTGFLILRIYRRIKLNRAEKYITGQSRRFTRIITPFTPIIDNLAASGVERLKNESFICWAVRSRLWAAVDLHEFEYLYSLHLRLRFDPEESSAEIEDDLRRGAEKYLRNLHEMTGDASSTRDSGKICIAAGTLPYRVFMKISTTVKK